MDEKIQKLVQAANSTNEAARTIGTSKLAEMGLDKDGNPLKKEEPKARKTPAAKKATIFKVDDVVYNKKFDTIGIVRIAEEKGEVKTDADGNVGVNTLELYNPKENKKHLKAKIALSTRKEIEDRRLLRGYKKDVEPKAKARTVRAPQYDCDDLITKERERKKKAKAAAEKRANAPKKTPATKNKEAVEKTAARVEKNVEVRAKKGDVTVAEIDKLISEYETAIKKLKELREKASGIMAKGGNLSSEETSKILERARGVHKHHCNCGDKMEKGGAVNPYSKWESDVTDNVAEMLDIPNGDAQGIVESNSFKMAQCWSKGLGAKETATIISKL